MIVFIGAIAILTLMFAGTFWKVTFISEGILGITAIVILWYTWETSQIRKAEREIAEVSKASLLKSYRPAVGHSIFTNENTPYDTRIGLVNLSDMGVAVKLRCNLKVDGEPIVDFAPAYEGTEFWNLQYKEEKEGHFNWLGLYLKKDLISKETINYIKEAGGPEEIRRKIHEYLTFTFNMSEPPKISMDIEIYCFNDKNQTAYYPPVHYSFDPYRMIWIPTITNEKPYWEFKDKPDWINQMPNESFRIA
jgi:hypothetical protein